MEEAGPQMGKVAPQIQAEHGAEGGEKAQRSPSWNLQKCHFWPHPRP